MHELDHPRRPARLLQASAMAALVLCAFPAAAQYKVVGADGRITYTDRPPAAASAGQVSQINRSGAGSASASAALPLELRQSVQRYPVTLYTSAECQPCETGRQLLIQRGIPYSEKLVANEDDAAALERLTNARTVPSLTVGTQVLRGFASNDWVSYLDAAGYPRESRLPRNWQPPAATPLTARAETKPEAPSRAAAPVARAPETPVVPATNPGGIRF